MIPSLSIFVRSVVRDRPRTFAASDWLPLVCASTRVMMRRSTSMMTSSYTAFDPAASRPSIQSSNTSLSAVDGDNSRWLLPNRLYEGGYFGVPAIGIATHETGRVIGQRRLGLSLEPPFVDHLREILAELTSEEYQKMRSEIEARPSSDFVDTEEMEELMDHFPSALRRMRPPQPRL